MTRTELQQIAELRGLVADLLARHDARTSQMDRIEADVKGIREEHTKTREMVIQHRTGWQVLVWVGGVAIAVFGAVVAAWSTMKGFK